MNKKIISAGTIGHIDHGKTTLTDAIEKLEDRNDVFIISDPVEDAKREYRRNKPFRDRQFLDDNYEEYQLILQKKSKLSAMKRREILERFKD